MWHTQTNLFYVCAILGQGVGGICAPTLVPTPHIYTFSLVFPVSMWHVMPNPTETSVFRYLNYRQILEILVDI